MQEREIEEHPRRLETIEERGLILFFSRLKKCLLFANLLNVHSQKMKKIKILQKRMGNFLTFPFWAWLPDARMYCTHPPPPPPPPSAPPTSASPPAKSHCVSHTHPPPSLLPLSHFLKAYLSFPILSPPPMEEFFPTPIEKEEAEEGQTV